ncbi:hypothetical protein KCP77_16305 [Salmonella enterica subsp. enterica]|nr:hypothetical protein KCP77_16305 [Salmonella enterica subsp. enterica]
MRVFGVISSAVHSSCLSAADPMVTINHGRQMALRKLFNQICVTRVMQEYRRQRR